MKVIRVIFVDDEVDLLPLFRICMSRALEEVPHSIKVADGAEACLQILAEAPKDQETLVITDVNMPKMNGFELIGKIKESFPKVRYYVCTAYDTPEYARKAADLGALRFFSKPLNFDDLKEAILADHAQMLEKSDL